MIDDVIEVIYGLVRITKEFGDVVSYDICTYCVYILIFSLYL